MALYFSISENNDVANFLSVKNRIKALEAKTKAIMDDVSRQFNFEKMTIAKVGLHPIICSLPFIEFYKFL